jgi:hypothetical protein
MTKPREWTKEEIREQFLQYIRDISKYWATVDLSDSKRDGGEILHRLNGLCHSILAMLDGCALELPGFLIISNPHPTDKEYHISQEENWYPQPPDDVELVDIGGALHEHFYEKD